MFIRRYWILVFLLIITSASCVFDKKEKCRELDNEIATINDSLLWYGSQWGDELEVAVNTLDFTQLPPIRIRMQDYIERKISTVQDMDNVGGSEELLEAELKFLKVEKKIVQQKLSAFEQFDETVSMDELSTAYASIQVSAVEEDELLREIHRLREEYEVKNDLPKFLDKY